MTRARLRAALCAVLLLQGAASAAAAGEDFAVSDDGTSTLLEARSAWHSSGAAGSISFTTANVAAASIIDKTATRQSCSQAIAYEAADEAGRLALLHGSCRQLRAPFWTYEWCHEANATQFLDPTARTRTLLGEFDGPCRMYHAHKYNLVTSSLPPSYYTSHCFIGGDKCGATGHQRVTEVQFHCCHAAVDDAELAYVFDATEPATCQYRLRVCVPSLCTAPAAGAECDLSGCARGIVEAPNRSSSIRSAGITTRSGDVSVNAGYMALS